MIYRELLRPQFHFTAKKNWLNDPNGLVFWDGEYHLWFQHNPAGIGWGNIAWGHAVSRDLVHWKQLPDALTPDEHGMMWSGSGVVDWQNTSGLGTGRRPPIVVMYTAVDPGAGKHAVQCIAASNDRGRTLVKYPGNPVLPHVAAVNRDPKVTWHEPSGSWVMALYLDGNDYALFRSRNLREWSRLAEVSIPGTDEFPDFFELAVDGDPGRRRWVFWGAAGVYVVGRFDGERFTADTEPLRCELGPNGYAAQTWSDIPVTDGRRIQVSWMRDGRYPSMPFNQQMSFPVELSLQSFPEGPRLCRAPVKEIALLYNRTNRLDGAVLEPGRNLAPEVRGGLFDIEAVVEIPAGVEELGLFIHGTDLRYSVRDGCFTYLDRQVPAPAPGGRLAMRLLVDRTSVELFVPPGRVSASFCFLPEPRDASLELYVRGGGVSVETLIVRELASAWR